MEGNIAALAATWDFGCIAISSTIDKVLSGIRAVDAVVEGIHTVELDERDQYFVGKGGYPNRKGEMELDAAIMDEKCNYGAVMALKNISNPIAVAKTVMEKCPHNILTGDGAFEWAIANHFKAEDILALNVKKEWEEWDKENLNTKTDDSHDTIGFICLDKHGKLSAGTSTSGWRFKHPGRVGDSPVIGSGLYCDGNVGAAVATGDGEEIMRTCMCFLIVEFMRQGKNPKEACSLGIARLLTFSRGVHLTTPLIVGVVAMDKNGNVGGASTLTTTNNHRGEAYFPVSCWRENMNKRNIEHIQRIHQQNITTHNRHNNDNNNNIDNVDVIVENNVYNREHDSMFILKASLDGVLF